MLGVLVIAAGAATWLALEAEENEKGSAASAVPAAEPGPGEEGPRRTSEPLRAPREPTLPVEKPPVETEPVERIDPRSALARQLDAVGATFLGEDPHVAELLELVGALASAAVVDPESLQVLRDDDGVPKVARGSLSVADLSATFVIEEGIFRIQFPAAEGQAPWFRRDLQISFGEASGNAAGCRAVLQFQPDPAESAAAHLRPDEERLVGWMLSVSSDTGAEIRPMSVTAGGDEWQIGSRRGTEARELPWISNTASFDAWLRVLQPHDGN